MALAANFLGGARSRLLPAHIPFRFFGAAVAFHLLAWLALLAGASPWPRFAGGLGWPLASLHLLTLGVFVMTAIGASLQLLPVATRQPVPASRWPALVWWLSVPGVAAVALGMGLGRPALLGAGAGAVLVALLVFAALLARNLRGARGMRAVVLHGWAALGSLIVVLLSAASLVFAYLGHPLIGRGSALALHLAFAAYGFMGLLALGLSYILVPMFALSSAPDEKAALASGALAIGALALAAIAAFDVAAMPLRLLALALGALSVGLHLRLMRRALREGLRKALGPSFTLVRVGWGGLLGSLAAGVAMVLEEPWAGTPMLFALLLAGVWLLSFVLGMLQRILPFLASMHAAGAGRRAPTPSSLSAQRPLRLHFVCHLAALAGLALAIALDSPAVVMLAAGIGALGAAGYAAFFVHLLRRLAAHRLGAT